MRPLNRSLLVCVTCVGFAMPPDASQGQRIADLSGAWKVTPVGSPELSIRRYPATSYFEGAAIGAGVFATTGALVWYQFGCHYSEIKADCAARPIVAASLVGALIGGTVGALVGGLFPAPHPRPVRGNPVKAALIGACAGGLWGFGPFSRFCLNGCHSDQVALGVSTTAVGALVGFVVGH
jgi:hypothetical protein